MFAEIAMAMAMRSIQAVAIPPPACASVDLQAFPCPPGTVVQTFTDPAPLAEDDPGWDCRTMGNGVCGPGGDPVHPEAWTVDGYVRNEAAARCLAEKRSFGTDADCAALYEDDGVRWGQTVTVRCPDGSAVTDDLAVIVAWFTFSPEVVDRGCTYL